MSQLQLNALNYKEFYGRSTEQMPILIAEGRTPLSIAGLMRRRLEVLNSSDEVKRFYWDNYFDTGDGIAYHPDGRGKIVLDAQPLRELTPLSSSQLRNGALVLPSGVYDRLEGVEFSREDLAKYITGGRLKQGNVKKNRVWQVLARDENLLNDYAKAVFSQLRERYNEDRAMGLYRGSAENVPTMRSWYLYRLLNWSDAYGYVHLGYDYGRLVGVAPEAQSATQTVARSTLDQIVKQ